MKQVCIHDDAANAILLSADHYKGIAVQVVRYAPTLEPDVTNGMVEHRNRHVIFSRVVPSVIDPESLSMIEHEKFKNSVKEAIAEAKRYLAKIMGLDQMIGSVLTDYQSQFQELNTDEQTINA